MHAGRKDWRIEEIREISNAETELIIHDDRVPGIPEVAVAQRQGRAQVSLRPAGIPVFIEIVTGIPIGIDSEGTVLLQVVVAAGDAPRQHPFREFSGPPDSGKAQDREKGLLLVGPLAFLRQGPLVSVGREHQRMDRRQARADFQGKALLPGHVPAQPDPRRLRRILGVGGKGRTQDNDQGEKARLHS